MNGWFFSGIMLQDLTLKSPSGIQELANFQEVKGEAKPYQIRQFLRLIERYNLKLEDEK